MATHSSILAWKMERGAWQAMVRGATESWTQLSTHTDIVNSHYAFVPFFAIFHSRSIYRI